MGHEHSVCHFVFQIHFVQSLHPHLQEYNRPSLQDQSACEISLIRRAQINNFHSIFRKVFTFTGTFLSQNGRCSHLLFSHIAGCRNFSNAQNVVAFLSVLRRSSIIIATSFIVLAALLCVSLRRCLLCRLNIGKLLCTMFIVRTVTDM
jgi:hypothetical protein